MRLEHVVIKRKEAQVEKRMELAEVVKELRGIKEAMGELVMVR